MNTPKRLVWLDTAKGLGALLVILGHFAINNKMAAIIYCFHMPLFFFLSGIVFNIDKYKTCRQFVIAKVKTLIIPYLIFNSFVWVYHVLRMLICGEDTMLIAKKFIGIFLQIKATDYYNSGWFILCIFITQILAYFIVRFSSGNKFLIMSSGIVGLAIGYFYISLIGKPILWGLDTSLIALFFFMLGYCCGTNNFFYGKKSVILYVPMAIGALVNFKLSGNRVEMYSNDYGVFWIFVVVALCGIFASIGISKTIEKSIFLQMLGQSSLYLYGAQFIFADIFKIIAKRYSLWGLRMFVSIPISIVLSVLCLILLLAIKKYYERLYGKCIEICNRIFHG